MKWNLPSLLLAILLAIAPLVVQAQPHANVTGETTGYLISEQPVNTTDAVKHPVRDSSIGCGTGAVLGTVVPGLGNVVGCLVGGLLGWWMS